MAANASTPALNRYAARINVVNLIGLALVGLVVASGLFMLLSWASTTLPANTTIACPQQPGCEASTPDETQLILGGDGRIRELKPTP